MDGNKSPIFVATSPQMAAINGAPTSPEMLSLTGNTEGADFTLNNEDRPNPRNVQLASVVADDDTSDSDQEAKDSDYDNDEKNMSSNSSNSLKMKRNLNRKHKGYAGVPTKLSYSDLQNASMYSLGDHESIIDIGDDQNEDADDGWPHFEPLDGPYPCSVYKKDLKQLKNEILSGLVVSFAQVPEAVAFSFLAGLIMI